MRDFWQALTRKDGGLTAVLVLAALHFGFLMLFYEPAISTPDANGYMAQARLIAREGRTSIATESPAQFVASHWFPARPDLYYGQYPPGLPALLAVVFRALGPAATLWVGPLMASLTLVALFLVCRAWVGAGWGLLAAAVMASNPYANQHALGADAHTAVAFFLMWGLVFLVRWERGGAALWAGLAGFCLGMIPTIRYPEALFPPAFAAFVALTPASRVRRAWALAAGLAGAAIPITALAIRNQAAFGAFWKTGYSLSGEQTAFRLVDALRHVVPYIVLLLGIGVAFVFVLGTIGIYVLCRRPETRRHGLFLASLVVPITLVYMAYYFSPSMRFLLPTFFLYAIAAVWVLHLDAQVRPVRARKAAAWLLGLMTVWGLPQTLFALRHLKQDNATLAAITASVAQHVEPGSILIAAGGIQQQLDFIGAWRLAAADAIAPDRHPGPPGMPRGESRTNDPQRFESFRRDLATWAGSDRKIYWLASQDQIDAFRTQHGNEQLVEVAQVRLPTGGRGPGPFGGPPDGPPDGNNQPRPPALVRLFFGPGPGGPPPGGPRFGPPGGPGGPPGGGARPRTPMPEMFFPPSDGTVWILQWRPGKPA